MITGIIQASGFSRRMNKEKLLLEVDGVRMVERVIKSCKGSYLSNIILVYRKEEIKNIGDKYNIKTVYNPNAHLGQSEGLKLGIREAGNSRAYMFLVGDQPYITAELINQLIYEYNNSNSPIVVPYYNGKRGMPTIFSSLYKDEFLKIEGDKGGRNIIEENISLVRKVNINDEKLGLDIDSPEDFNKLI